MSDKKGLSTIIVTLILILLSLVAVGIVWVVVSNILQSGTEQTSSGLGQIFLSIGIENVKVESNGDVSVSVKRNAGEGDLSGINFIVSDGENSQVIKKSESLGELATKTFTITSAELTDVAFVKEVSIAPISGTEGKEKVGSVVDKFEKNKIGLNDLKDYGIVSWWRFEDDAKDEVGENDGTPQGSVNFVDGKYGKAGNFDDVGDYISVADNANLQLGKSMTVVAWINPKVNLADWARIVGKGSSTLRNYGLWRQADGDALWQIYSGGGTMGCMDDIGNGPLNVPINTWANLIGSYDGTNIKIYRDGKLEKTCPYTQTPYTSTDPLTIGYAGFHAYFNGQIDEVMIFNKALTPEQVKALYEMNLS